MGYKRIGRNDPCPCGSGKKYKKCCFGNDDKTQAEESEDFFEDLQKEQWFGYTKDASGDESDKYLSCLLQQADEGLQKEVSEKYKYSCQGGDWILSSGQCDDIKIFQPFKSKEEAFEFGNKHLNIAKWKCDLFSMNDGI